MRVFADLDELLKEPESAPGTPARLLLGAAFLTTLYGAAAGCFQGGPQIAVAALKAPLIVLGSVLLSSPSLYVFTALAGARIDRGVFAGHVARFAGLLGLVLVGLLPIGWLFSVSSRSLLFMVWFHVVAWLVALLFAYRFLAIAFRDGSKATLLAWSVLYACVSLQLATQLTPVLWRPAGGSLFQTKKGLFTEMLGEAARHDSAMAREAEP